MKLKLFGVVALLAACATAQSAKVSDEVHAMVGKMEERIVSCMGVPTANDRVGDTKVWSYSTVTGSSSVGGATVNQYRMAIVGSTTGGHFCVVNFTFRDGVVTGDNYTSQGQAVGPVGLLPPDARRPPPWELKEGGGTRH